MTLELVERWYSELSEWERTQPLIIVDRLAYPPAKVIREVRAGTTLGHKLQEKLEQGGRLGLTDTTLIRNLAKKRLLRLIEKRPAEILSLSIERPVIKPEELRKEIVRETEMGKRMIELEKEHMQEIMRLG